MAGAQVEIVANQIDKGRLGYMGLSLTNYDADTEPAVASGSKVEIGGALFEFTAPESITGWGGIGASNDVYIKLVVSGTAVTAEFTTTAPTWSTSKQGWYDSLDRYVAKLYKDGSSNYTRKRLLYWPTETLGVLGTGTVEVDGVLHPRGLVEMQAGGDIRPAVPAAGANVWIAGDPVSQTVSYTYTLVKQIVAPASGTFTIAFDLSCDNAGERADGRIYKNGVAFGTERSVTGTSYSTYTEDLAFTVGDLVQIYARKYTTPSGFSRIRNFRVQADIALGACFKQILQATHLTYEA